MRPPVEPQYDMAQKIILDTDIGDDIDDALALGLACRRPEIEIVGVTTVFGNVRARSQQARTVLVHAGSDFRNVPVASGCGASMASRPLHNLKDYLDDIPHSQSESCLPESDLPPLDPRHGVDFLIESLLSGDGDIVPVPIGAMTNIAMAIVKEPRIIAKIPRIVTMSAEFDRSQAEWNILCDPEAASIVFNSGIPIEVITWTMGRRTMFTPEDITRLAASASPLAQNLLRAVRLWQGSNRNAMPALYDPLTIVAIVQPDILEWQSGRVTVELNGSATYGYTLFKRDPNGPHRVAFGVNRDRAMEFILGSITSD